MVSCVSVQSAVCNYKAQERAGVFKPMGYLRPDPAGNLGAKHASGAMAIDHTRMNREN